MHRISLKYYTDQTKQIPVNQKVRKDVGTVYSDCNNWRDITLLLRPGKLFCSLLKERLKKINRDTTHRGTSRLQTIKIM